MFKALKKKLNNFKDRFSRSMEEELDGDVGGVGADKGESTGKGVKIAKRMVPKVKRRHHAQRPKDVWIKDEEEKPLIEEGGGLFAQTLRSKKIAPLLDELEMGLLESDVAIEVASEIRQYVENEIAGKKIARGADMGDAVETALRNAIENVLKANYINFDDFVKRANKPVVIMFVGINGTGKTTAIAKVAYRLKKMGFTSVLAASDTFRAGAIEQLDIHAKRLGIKIIKHQKGSDPAAIAYDAIEHAKARRKDVVLIDTAGRMHSNVNLMEEMKKIKRVANPDMVIFVGEALAGNDAVAQAKEFNKAVEIDGVILTKIDADAKGGAALSIAHAVGKPIIFIGTGQTYKDLVPFNPGWMVSHIFES